MRYLALSSILFVIVMISCGKGSGHVLSEKEMESVMYDMYLVDAVYQQGHNNTKTYEYKDQLIASVLAKHGITQVELDSSLMWYSDNIELYGKVMDSVASKLERASKKMTDSRNTRMWQMRGFTDALPLYFALDMNIPRFAFNIDSVAMKTFAKEEFLFSFDVMGADTLRVLDAAVYYTYKDTIIVDRQKIDKNMNVQFVKPQLPDSSLISLSGYVRLNDYDKLLTSILLNNISNKSVKKEVVSDSISIDYVPEDMLQDSIELK